MSVNCTTQKDQYHYQFTTVIFLLNPLVVVTEMNYNNKLKFTKTDSTNIPGYQNKLVIDSIYL